jgi:hypothetical protein
MVGPFHHVDAGAACQAARMVATCKDVHRRIVLNTPLALFIDNAFVAPVRGNHMLVVDPADESVITTQCPAATAEDVDLAVAAATRAFPIWSRTTGAYVRFCLATGQSAHDIACCQACCWLNYANSRWACLPGRSLPCSRGSTAYETVILVV